MNDYKALALAVKEINKIQQEHAAFLAASRADSFDEYKKVCGIIRGLAIAENLINDLVQKMEHSDE